MTERGLRLERLAVARDGVVLARLDAMVRPGEALTVMGPSGVGKSTLLAFIAGFRDPGVEASGRVLLDGVDISSAPPEARRIGLLFQDPMLFPHLSVRGNVLFGAPREGSAASAAERRLRADAALAALGLDDFGDRDPATLSGGQAARVALSRALMAEPRALLLDEPFSKLDAALRAETRGLVADAIAQARTPAVLVTHDPADAAAFPGDVVEL